jgi:hypothetical protein
MWHWLLHVLGVDNVSGPWYGWWSGAGSDIAELGILTGLYANYKKHNCHVKWCPRVGHFPFEHETHVENYCRKHHPVVPDKPITSKQAKQLQELVYGNE